MALPSPDSPVDKENGRNEIFDAFQKTRRKEKRRKRHTNNEQSELESLLDGLAVHLVGEVGKANEARELFLFVKEQRVWSYSFKNQKSNMKKLTTSPGILNLTKA